MKTFNTLQQLAAATILTGTPVRILEPSVVDGIVKATGEGLTLLSGNVFVVNSTHRDIRKTAIVADEFPDSLTTVINRYSRDSLGNWEATTTGLTSNVVYNGQLWEPMTEVTYKAGGYFIVGWNVQTIDSDVLELIASDASVIQFSRTAGFTPIPSADVKNLKVFVDSTDGKLKFKDATGVVTGLTA